MDFLKDNWKITASLAAAAATGALAGAAISNRNEAKENIIPQRWIKVGTVSELMLYPVKSCKGNNVHEASCTKLGLQVSKYDRDRIFLIVDERMVYQTQRTIPKMALVSVSINDNHVSLSSPGVNPVTFIPPEDIPGVRRSCRIFDDKVAVALDCGDEVAGWLSQFLEKEGLRLLYHASNICQRELNPQEKKFPNFTPTHKGAFADETSYMVISEASVQMVNSKVEKSVTHRNFRPNVLISGVIDPFSEDKWGYVRIGHNGPLFKALKPCMRCKLTTVDPDKGTFDQNSEPLNTLRKLVRSYGNEQVDKLAKNQAVIGLQLGIFEGEGETIRVGDPVYAAVL